MNHIQITAQAVAEAIKMERDRCAKAYFVKRPIAFCVPRADPRTAGETLGNEWRLFQDEKAARDAADDLGVEYQGLYIRDGSAIVAEWKLINTAPKDSSVTFLVCAIDDPRPPFVIRADILWSARKEGTPSRLTLSHLTHWMPLPPPPSRSTK